LLVGDHAAERAPDVANDGARDRLLFAGDRYDALDGALGRGRRWNDFFDDLGRLGGTASARRVDGIGQARVNRPWSFGGDFLEERRRCAGTDVHAEEQRQAFERGRRPRIGASADR
jgi:hypothetical protein